MSFKEIIINDSTLKNASLEDIKNKILQDKKISNITFENKEDSENNISLFTLLYLLRGDRKIN